MIAEDEIVAELAEKERLIPRQQKELDEQAKPLTRKTESLNNCAADWHQMWPEMGEP